MGVSPFPAASPAASPSVTAGPSDTDHLVPVRFAMPHALVLVVCIVTAAVLAELGMAVKEVFFLLAGAAGIGAAVLVLVTTGGRSDGRLGRFLDAYRTSGRTTR
ncbi:hypothetical protein [Actinacidiphila rubida]|uniref:Uncharacterized protein n=1 Tax=Actinacidiphila rubida TaxID=310780 RepID=A0A1H8UHF7_9ACTN|nr:hypothetical protein [Actinacidiphila rubida]SEP02649.1 hypothetical protein SAMN05216267_107316 [Actinacidiphila rubida]